jgi:hypothetical protein
MVSIKTVALMVPSGIPDNFEQKQILHSTIGLLYNVLILEDKNKDHFHFPKVFCISEKINSKINNDPEASSPLISICFSGR